MAAIAVLLVYAASASAQPAEPAEEEESTITIEEPAEEPAEEPSEEPEPPAPPVEPDEEPEPEPVEEPPPPPPPPEPEPGIPLVEAGWGHMKLLGVMQALVNMPDLGDEEDSRDIEFNLKRMRLLLTGGFLDDRIGYLVQGDMVNMEGFLLDARASLRPLKGLEIRFGRFIPDFTQYMPRNVAKLMMIDYPVVTSSFAVWRQMGLEIWFKHQYFDIIAGVFNGMRFEPDDKATNAAGDEEIDVSKRTLAKGYMSANKDNLTDDNVGKDFLFRFIARPIEGLQLGGYVWYGMPQYKWLDVATDTVKDDAGNLIHFGIEAGYLHEKFNVLAEYAMRRIYYPSGTDVDPDPLVSHGGYLHLGYKFIEMLEVMMRGDYFDTDMDSDLGQQIWGTLGLNYYLDGVHARMTLEYIMQSKQREDAAGKTEYYINHGLYFQLCLLI